MYVIVHARVQDDEMRCCLARFRDGRLTMEGGSRDTCRTVQLIFCFKIRWSSSNWKSTLRRSHLRADVTVVVVVVLMSAPLLSSCIFMNTGRLYLFLSISVWHRLEAPLQRERSMWLPMKDGEKWGLKRLFHFRGACSLEGLQLHLIRHQFNSWM
jgi:hypothetical protein